MPIQFSTFNGEDGSSAVSVFVNGQLKQTDDSHPSFKSIVAACEAAKTDLTITGDDILPLFDIAETVAIKFQQLTERVAVRNGVITLDGDPVHGTLQTQILDFVEAGEDFDPLVKFYERLSTNPLGDVREGIFDWIKGRTGEQGAGAVTITPEGKLIGYKAFTERAAKLRADEAETVYVSSRPARNGDLVNGVEVPEGEYAEHLPGDVVEMPRSIVLHDPSSQCGVGLHIGTYAYASSFAPITLLVEFDPRDVVSVPDSQSSVKLRVCRYTILDVVDGPLEVPVYQATTPEREDELDVSLSDEPEEEGGDFSVGDLIRDSEGDVGVVTRERDEDGDIEVDFAGNTSGTCFDGTTYVEADTATVVKRNGYSGPTSQAAKGNGRNAAQDAKGRFSAGRPGSARDASTGRFA